MHDFVLYAYASFFTDSFFFQAEDGIRDLVRSRGLGDVYKRQSQDRAPGGDFPEKAPPEGAGIREKDGGAPGRPDLSLIHI